MSSDISWTVMLIYIYICPMPLHLFISGAWKNDTVHIAVIPADSTNTNTAIFTDSFKSKII